MVASLIAPEQLRKPTAVRDAKFEGVTSPALVDLVLEALASSGAERRGLLACQTRNAV